MSRDVLYLVIRLGADRYAIETSQVVEVLPLVRLKELPGAPAGVAGVMNFRDSAVPVVDLNLIAMGSATPLRRTTRIVIVQYEAEEGPLGLLVPEATEALRLDADAFVDARIATEGARYLGDVLTTPDGVIQRVTVSALLTPELRDALFRPAGSA
ncbi:MAG: chemotaxis protein CheW [bacterium]